eukprot:scaffold119692_cov21-Tisochrysis_lutea.AAC.1
MGMYVLSVRWCGAVAAKEAAGRPNVHLNHGCALLDVLRVVSPFNAQIQLPCMQIQHRLQLCEGTASSGDSRKPPWLIPSFTSPCMCLLP